MCLRGMLLPDFSPSGQAFDLIDAFLARLGGAKKRVTESDGEAVTESYTVSKRGFIESVVSKGVLYEAYLLYPGVLN